MTMIFSSGKTNIPIKLFYIRRLKRIVPTCAFTLVLFIAISYFVLLLFHFGALLEEALWSIGFINNMAPILKKQNYFEMLSEFKFFLHTWSLGVEVQFYLIAPFLIKFLLSRKYPLFWVNGIMLLSFASQHLVSSKELAFGFMPCRIWQFLAGTNAHFYITLYKEWHLCKYLKLETMPKIFSSKTFISLTMFMALFILSFCPLNFQEMPLILHLCRILATQLTSIILILQIDTTHSFVSQNVNTFLVYIGNASYSLYLVHWPIIVLFNYLGINNNYAALTLILITTVFVHEFFEKFMAKFSWHTNAKFVIACYSFIILTFSMYATRRINNLMPMANDNLTFVDPIRANEYEASTCENQYYLCKELSFNNKYYFETIKNEMIAVHCSEELDPTSSGNKTIVILGNSFAYFQMKGIKEAIKQAKTKIFKIYFLIYRRCNVLMGTMSYSLSPRCKKLEKDYKKFLADLKPEVIIFSSRFVGFRELKIPYGNNNDTKAQMINKQLNHHLSAFSSFTKKFILIEPTPSSWINRYYRTPYSIARALIAKTDLNLFKFTVEDYEINDGNAWKWVENAIRKCKNCIIIPTKNLYCEEINCYLADLKTKIAQYCDSAHITPQASMKLIPSLIKAIDL